MGHIMLTDFDFAKDAEFTKLLARRDDVELTTAALELARDAYPQLDFSATQDWIARRASEIAPRILQAPSEEHALGLLAECLSGKHGITGSRTAYLQADSSYLNRVIETSRGIPISLSVIYMAVANQAGLGLHGVAAPGHFMTRYEAVDGPLFIDAFSDGDVLNLDQMLLRVTLTTGMSEERALTVLEPASSRTIIIRMLNNLKNLYSQQENWDAAWKVQHRLAALQPSSYEERRDLGLMSVKANRPGPAVDLLETCLKSASKGEADAIEFQLAEARRQLSEWN
ncbi:MAG: tetratricopeptide repeat protein [Planctomycetota bacterium]